VPGLTSNLGAATEKLGSWGANRHSHRRSGIAGPATVFPSRINKTPPECAAIVLLRVLWPGVIFFAKHYHAIDPP
jgi:hypothetical protein